MNVFEPLSTRLGKRASITAVLVPIALATMTPMAVAQSKNGFDLTGSTIPPDEILPGGPPRDGIPALTDPTFEDARDVAWLEADDRVIALAHEGEAKAYPIRIMNWHEVVNDEIGGRRVAVTYCPLCGTGMVFDPHVRGDVLEFGVSGLLYNSDVLMYDRKTESLWSQIEREAVTGPLVGERLDLLPAVHTTWARWREQNPEGLVLSRDTGHARDYGTDPYLRYASTPGTFFPVNHEDARLAEKEFVLGIERGNAATAFPLRELANQPRPVRGSVGDEEVLVYHFPESKTSFATTLDGDLIPATIAFWFAWSAFHPDTALWASEVSGS